MIDHNNWQIDTQATLDILEARPEMPDPSNPGKTIPAHPPGVFQSANDYGEETTELEVACRLLGNDCSYALKQTIKVRKTMLKQMRSAGVMMKAGVTNGLEDLHLQDDSGADSSRAGVSARSEQTDTAVDAEKDSGK